MTTCITRVGNSIPKLTFDKIRYAFHVIEISVVMEMCQNIRVQKR